MTEDVLLDLIKRVTRVTRNQGDKLELEELTGEVDRVDVSSGSPFEPYTFGRLGSSTKCTLGPSR
ncbi:hypothetical protein F2Q68_00029699 [Brassica cretica]|uniref:Uncharacterized protein n=1 Tax=Brassica cretica TaxID=69181 RepID=A0A8S9G214_BRACR|nr:hypothetical protein F2Q68_00029699 [Brassica cretica]